MNKHPLQTILENCEYKCVAYTGRGMRKSCLATYPTKNIGNMFADILDELSKTNEVDLDILHPVMYVFQDMRTDSMGKNTIIYFPTVEYVEDEEGDDDEL